MTGSGAPPKVLLGAIAGAHGIRGEVTIRTFTGDPADITSYGALSDKTGARTFKLAGVRVTAKGVVARIAGVADRNAAEALRGTELYVERAALPEADAGEYYHADLIGCAAVDAAGVVIGRIVAVPNFGAGDLLEIETAPGRPTDLILFTDAFVPVVDVANRRVTVVLPTLVEPDNDDDAPPAA